MLGGECTIDSLFLTSTIGSYREFTNPFGCQPSHFFLSNSAETDMKMEQLLNSKITNMQSTIETTMRDGVTMTVHNKGRGVFF